jgi:nitric oxide reductase activation protein
VPSLRILEGLNIPYRDDNRFLWAAEEFSWEQEQAYLPASQRQVRKYVSVMEMVNEVEVETAGDDAQEVWVLATELFPYEDEGISYNQMEGKEPVSDPFHYPEWDYHVQLHRPAWATVYERRQGRGDPELIDKVLTEHKGVSHRIKQIIDRLRPQGVSRQRKLEDGDELDINAAVDAMVTLRIGLQPDMRITMRHVINRRDLAVLILLDLSESTNETVRGTERTVLELTREACALVATAIEGIGDPFAIHGFASDGRHDVQYYRFKDFEQHLDADVKSRLAGMKGGLSTRMGAAMRHAGWHLMQRPEKHKLLLLVTDGEPADIDERDPQYLRMDTKKATEELKRGGILSYCLTLDPEADRYVSRIFGATNYTIIDNVKRLPEKLPALFASLTR